MRGDIPIGRLAGIPLYLHWSWFLALFLIAWTLAATFFPQSLPQFSSEPIWYWGLGLVAALGLFISVLLHELGHAFVAKGLRIPVRAIRLFIFGGVAEIAGEPRKPSHEIVMALAGPAVTLVLILVYVLGLFVVVLADRSAPEIAEVDVLQRMSPLAAATGALLQYLATVNAIVLVFNMIPAFPLDGGRVFRAILWSSTGSYLKGTRIAGWVGISFAWFLFVSGFFMVLLPGGNLLSGMWLFFLGMFLQNAAHSSMAYAQIQQLLTGVQVHEMMRPEPVMLAANQSLDQVVEQYFLHYPFKAYPVVEGDRLIGMLTLRGLQEVPRNEWESLHAGDVAERYGRVPALRPEEPALNALRRMAESGHGRLPVVEHGRVVGLLSRKDIMDFLEIRAELAETAQKRTPLTRREVLEEARSLR